MKTRTEPQKLYTHYITEKHYKHMANERMIEILTDLNKKVLEEHQHREVKRILQLLKIEQMVTA